MFAVKDVDFVVVTKNYKSKNDGYRFDKKLINDQRYKQVNGSNIGSVLINYRIACKQVFPIVVDLKSKSVDLYNKTTKTNNNSIFNNSKLPSVELQYIDWDDSLTKATLYFTNHISIVIDKDTVKLTSQKQSKQYRLSSFKSIFTHDKPTSWPTTLKNNTKEIKTILTRYNTTNKLNGVVKTVDDFETAYQELQPNQQTDSVVVLKTIRRLLDTLAVDNPTIMMYYLLSKQPIKTNVVMM